MITIYSYHESSGLEVTENKEKLRELLGDEKRINWVDFEEPTEEESELLDTVFNFHPLAIDDCLNPQEQPKVDNYGPYLFLVVHGVTSENTETDFMIKELDVFLGKNYVVTYHNLPMKSVQTISERIDRNAKPTFRSADFLLATLLDELVDLYTPLLNHFDRRVDNLEEHILEENDGSNILNDIFNLKRNLHRLKKISAHQITLLTHMIKDGYDEILPVSIPYLSNVRDHLQRASDLSDSYRDEVASLVDVHLLTTSNKANETMKVLTVFAAIMLPLTVITGIYGMNFEGMPEISWKYGYPFALGTMLVVAGGLFYYFKRKKWV